MRFLKLSNGMNFPVLGMGTWCFGGRESRNPDNDDAGQIEALQKGIAADFTLIDTAEYYAAGYAETLVGRAISGVPRESLFLTSKVWKTHLHRDDLLRAAEASCRRLKTDYLDLYLYHQIDESVPLEESIGAMNELLSQKLVRAIGVSNFSADRLRRAVRCSAAPITVDQVQYNLAVRQGIPELLECCMENKIVLQAWRPLRDLAPSVLTEKLCAKYGITFFQLALAWLLNQENVAAITAMKNPAHLPENLGALQVTLEPEDQSALEKEYGPRRPAAVPLK